MAKKLSSREFGLLIVLGGAALAYYVFFMRTGTGPRLDAGAASDLARSGVEAPEVRLDLLAQAPEDYDPQGRDLFKYAKRPPSAEELRRLREEEERRRREAEEAARRAAELAARQRQQQIAQRVSAPPPPARPRPPQVNLRYIGYLGPKEDRNAVFEDGDEVLLARKGEIVKDEFRILEIKYGSVVVGYTNPQFANETHELAMSGGK